MKELNQNALRSLTRNAYLKGNYNYISSILHDYSILELIINGLIKPKLYFSFVGHLTRHMSCLPIDFETIKQLSGNFTIPMCSEPAEFSQWYEMVDLLNIAKQFCKKSCKITNYKGISKIWIEYSYISNEIQVQHEYFIYGIDELIGSVGGILGLFIGFSFVDFLLKIINSVKDNVINRL